MRLCASAMAWPPDGMAEARAILASRGVRGIEIVPAKAWPGWTGATARSAAALSRELRDEGFATPAFQSLFFGIEQVSLLGSSVQWERMSDHILRVADLAAEMGAGVLVFGSPGLRRTGGQSPALVENKAVSRLRRVCDTCLDSGVRLCMEPNARAYGCDFVTSAAQADRLVGLVDSTGFGLHLDTGSALMEGADPAAEAEEFAGRFAHLHASEPMLAAPGAPGAAVDHAAVGARLAETAYEGWVSLEIKESPLWRADLDRACAILARAYGDTDDERAEPSTP